MDTTITISEHDWIQLQLTIAELKSRVHDLELRIENLESDHDTGKQEAIKHLPAGFVW